MHRIARPAEDDILVETLPEGIVVVRLNRPERLNAIGYDTAKRLDQAIAGVCRSDARVLLMAGSGRAFCAGADLKERRGMSVEQRLAHTGVINAAVDALAAAPMPTIAVIHGVALGGGCEIALACDFRIASSTAKIGLTESRIGAIPAAGGTQRMPRLIGVAHALQLMLLGEPVTGQRAAEIGLVTEVVDEADLNQRALALANLLASRSPLSMRIIKRLVNEGTQVPLAEGLQRERQALRTVLASRDYLEGLTAFEEKRTARFRGD